MKMKQYLIITLAAVFFTACGQKKESAQQAAADVVKPGTPTAEEQTKLDANKAKADAEKIEADKKAQVNRGTIDTKRAGTKPLERKQVKNQKGKPSSIGKRRTQTRPEEKIATTQELQFTGGKSKSGYVYTGSSSDAVINNLALQEQNKEAGEFARNAQLAASVWDMSYLVDSSGKLFIDIKFLRGGGLSKLQVNMPYTPGRNMNISANSSGMLVDITAKCIDASMTSERCSNLLVTFTQNGAQAKAVLRQTYADVWFEYQDVRQFDEYARFVEFFKNAHVDSEVPNKLEAAYLHTYEVVNGKSGFTALVAGKQNQLIALEADLLVKPDLSAPQIEVLKETRFADVDMWMGRQGARDMGYSSMINDAKLVQNSTKGQITIDMNVVTPAGQSSKFTMRFTRVPVAAEL